VPEIYNDAPHLMKTDLLNRGWTTTSINRYTEIPRLPNASGRKTNRKVQKSEINPAGSRYSRRYREKNSRFPQIHNGIRCPEVGINHYLMAR
jgi:hypothetical protein